MLLQLLYQKKQEKFQLQKTGTLIADVKEETLKKILIKNLITKRKLENRRNSMNLLRKRKIEKTENK